MTNPQRSDPILVSVRLGWLTVEAFGRLRRWTRSGRQPSPTSIGASHRFTFSDRDPTLYEQLLITLQQLEETAIQLAPEYPPPIPENPEDLLAKAKNNMDASWLDFENWSRVIWNTLQIQDPLSGLAFTSGGSLADTYWHAESAGHGELKDLLRSQRLENIAFRFDSIAEFLPDHTAQVIYYTLYRWRMADRLKDLDDQQKKHLLDRLEAQAKVWCDLLFGRQRAEDYLTGSDRRLITWGAFGASALLAILVGLAVWSAVLLLSTGGRTLLMTMPGSQGNVPQASSSLAVELLDWQKWSALLAALSSVVVVLTGFITRLSGWIIAFHRWVRNRLTLGQIFKRTYRR